MTATKYHNSAEIILTVLIFILMFCVLRQSFFLSDAQDKTIWKWHWTQSKQSIHK